MEFLDIHLTEDSSRLLHAVHSLSTRAFLNQTLLCVKKYIQKIQETRKLESLNKIASRRKKNEGRKSDENSNLRRLEFMPRNLE